jgi:hypothetical protein
VILIPSTDPRCGRHVEHDEESRRFALTAPIDKSTWVNRRVRIFDPSVNPNQSVGNCTMCAKAMQLNAGGNRLAGDTLDMAWAMLGYGWETANDEYPGQYPPDDTGSSGLAACKTAQHFGKGGEYRWIFGGADEVVANVMTGKVVNVGTTWYNDMFTGYKSYYGLPVIKPGGTVAGGHEWAIRGYSVASDRVLGRCWWGALDPTRTLDVHKDFWIARGDLESLLQDSGDAHWQMHA